MAVGLGRFSIVGAAVKSPDRLPDNVVADEKHTPLCGNKSYIAMTAANNCILGAEMVTGASGIDLTREWASQHLPESPMKQHTLDLCQKRERFITGDDHATAHRTSNMVDRLMKIMDRTCFTGQYFHCELESGNQRIRSVALLWNFCPSSPATIKKHQGQFCPAERLNGKSYSDSWLTNLLVSASMNGRRGHQQNAL